MSDAPADVRVMVAIPSAGRVALQFAVSLAAMTACFASDRVQTLPEASITMSIRTLESSNWITNREKLARMAVDEDFTHLLWLDDDMTFDPRVMDTLLGRRQDVVLTNYLIKSEPAQDFVAVKLNGKRLPTTERSRGLQPVLYSGFGVALIRTEVFRRVAQPWFLPRFNAEKSEYTTEDFPFFDKVREAGFTVYIDHDASKMVAHLGSKTWHWSEATNG